MKPEEIGHYLKELRLQHKLTQKELASKLHITHQAVSNWEKGKALPDISILSQLGDVYGVSIDNLLLKEVTGEQPPKKKRMALRRILTFFGLSISLNFIASFLFYNRHIVSSTIFVVFLMIGSLLYSYLRKERKWWIEYLIITGLILIVSLITIPRNIHYFMMDTTNYFELDDQVEINYPRQFDEMTKVVTFEHIFDTYAMIYTESEEDIDIFNLSKYHEGEYQTIETPNMPIYDIVFYDQSIYLTTYDDSIPGAFKLYELDFETKEFTVLYESQEVLRMYKAFYQIYFISDPFLEPQTNVYEFDPTTKVMSDPFELDFPVYGMAPHFVRIEDDGDLRFEDYLILSVTNLEPDNPINSIAVFDYQFDLQHVLYEEQDAVIHLLFHDYGNTVIGTRNGAILFQNLDTVTLGEEYARWPKIVSPDIIRVNESLYQRDWDTDEFHLYSDTLFYENNEPQGARFLISDGVENLYALDNHFIGVVQPVPREIETPRYSSATRATMYVMGTLSYGLFLTLGHKPTQPRKS